MIKDIESGENYKTFLIDLRDLPKKERKKVKANMNYNNPKSVIREYLEKKEGMTFYEGYYIQIEPGNYTGRYNQGEYYADKHKEVFLKKSFFFPKLEIKTVEKDSKATPINLINLEKALITEVSPELEDSFF